MDINHQQAPTFTMMTIISTILSWITLVDAQYILSFVLTCIGIVSGMLAIRYYWLAGNKMKNEKSDK
jgi:hypothetical protein